MATGTLTVQAVGNAYAVSPIDGQPVDLQFGDKIIHFEVRDTVDEPPEETPAPPRGRTDGR